MNQDKQVENLNILLDSLTQQLLSEKLKLRKTRSLLLSKRQLLQSTHRLLGTEFQGAFSDFNEVQAKGNRRRRYARPFGMVPLLDETSEQGVTEEVVTFPVEHENVAAIQVTANAWHSRDDDDYWVRAHVYNPLNTKVYNVQLHGYMSHCHSLRPLPRRDVVPVLRPDGEIDLCATYQADPGHDIEQLDDLYLVYSLSDGGPPLSQRVESCQVQDRSNMTWLPTHQVADVRPSINVFFPHCIKLRGETELLSSIIEHGKMKIVPNSCQPQNMTIWVSDDQRMLAAKSGNQIQIACVDGIHLERLVSRLRACASLLTPLTLPSKTWSEWP